MTVHRDPRTMSRDELVAYCDSGGDISELFRGAVPGPDLGPAPSPGDIRMIVTGVRLPSATVERLDALAGNDKGGRSGVIRRAIDEFPGAALGRGGLNRPGGRARPVPPVASRPSVQPPRGSRRPGGR